MFGYELIRSDKLDKLYADLRRVTEDYEKAKTELADVRERQGESVDELVRMLSKSSKVANENAGMLAVSEDARKNLAEKNKKVSVENGELRAKVELLERQLEYERSLNLELKDMYNNLSESHELVIKGLHDSTVEVT